MVKKVNQDEQPQAQNEELHRLNRRAITFFIIAVSMLLMGCFVANYFVEWSDSSFWEPDGVQIVGDPKPTTEVINPSTSKPAIPEPKPTNPPVELPVSAPNNGGTSEYSVSAQDFSCICRVDGNVNIELRMNGDQLETVDPNGSVQVYDQIGENTYKRSWMGYYILVVDGQDTQVDEEKSVVIILTDTGYVMEHYSGTESSPCCIHTFTKEN
jgi:hypothetical protein